MRSNRPAQGTLALAGSAPKSPGNGPVANDKARWVGMEINHRRLFDALQSGWLVPCKSQGGHLLAERAFVREPDEDAGTHPIRLRVKLDPAKLPEPDVLFPREGHRNDVSRPDASGAISFWPSALPTFAISELAVATVEERARLISLADSFSNIELPARPIVAAPGACVEPVAFLTKQAPSPGIPVAMDTQQGAMCMAIWAVPRMEPWLNLLLASLCGDERLQTVAEKVGAPWFSAPPWMQKTIPGYPCNGTLQGRLWRVATSVLADAGIATSCRDLAESTAAAAGMSKDVDIWLKSTLRILRAEAAIQFDLWQSNPVGIAIQLVLARPQPARFKTWLRDAPGLPPAIWWSAAILCGLLTGYRALDRKFRGSAAQQEVLSVHAFRICGGDKAVSWPSVTGKPRWTKRGEDFLLLWGHREVAKMRAQNRSKWLNADLDSPETAFAAKSLAKRLEWPCLSRQIAFRKPCRLETDTADLLIDNDTLDILRPTAFRLPKEISNSDVAIEDTLDVQQFRHLLVVGPGRLSEPPPEIRTVARGEDTGSVNRKTDRVAEVDVVTPKPRAAIGRNVLDIAGLMYMTDFLDKKEEYKVLREIDGSAWSEELQRRVQHYGWKYDYKAREIDPSMHIGALPGWATELGQRLVNLGLLGVTPDQVIVNEYRGDQGISMHTDSRSFADGIATISLLESWEMNFRLGNDRRKIRLERRSVLVMHGDARYRWKHGLPKRKTEPNSPGMVPKRVYRDRRISLTFRKVRQ